MGNGGRGYHAMPVRIQCSNPKCRGTFSVTDAGRIGYCPSCGWKLGSVSGSEGEAPPGAGGISSFESIGSPWDLTPKAMVGGRYRVDRKLGAGAMGAVYLAEDTKLRRLVALKVPHQDLCENNPKFLDRLYREAQIAARFNDPRICSIHDIDHADGLHYIVMRYVEGKTLEEVLGGRPLDPADAAAKARSLAETLQEAHSRDIIHRDLKPANLMVGLKGELIVMDFGLAKRMVTEAEDHFQSMPGTFRGTLVYASPEQVEARDDEIGPGSDIYALGVILYQLLTGRLPFEASGRYMLMNRIVNEPPEPPSRHAPEVGPELDAIVLRAMAKNIPDRFATMTEFARALRDYLEKPSTVPPTTPAPDPGASTVEPPIPPPTRYEEFSTSEEFEILPDEAEFRPAIEPEPPSVELSREYGPQYIGPRSGMRLIRVEPGEFTMGSADGDLDERPAHKVRIDRAFYLGRCPVTHAEYANLYGRTPGHFLDDPKNPVEQVDWLDAVRFCNSLSVRDGLPPFYRVGEKAATVADWRGPGYRLPTEAEWEYACRAGRSSRFGFGDDETKLGRYAWYAANSGGKTHPVGSKRANAWGFHDMHGNVWEWCWDGYDPQSYKRPKAVDPTGPESARPFRVLRGGNWRDDPAGLRSAKRLWFVPSIRLRYIGFRVARTAE
jgi:formylglycine-generating enzyme required for sulfatase activity